MGKVQNGGGKMGHAKHRKSGVAPKSPKLRMKLKLEAERQVPQEKPKGEYFSSFDELFKKL